MPVALRFGLFESCVRPFVEVVEAVVGVDRPVLSGEDERLDSWNIVWVVVCESVREEMRSTASSRRLALLNTIFKDGCPLSSKVNPSRRQKLR